jgi:pimeloyl-ACP methyl ester carboxylesterase
MATYVLVHGSYQGGWIWQPVANRLRAAGHQVYAPSLDGCGERKGQMRPGITTETQADEVAQLLFYEDLKDVVLVGTSYGGMVACRAAELMRERIGRLVFVDALTLFDGEKVADILPRTTSVADGVTLRPSPEDAATRLFADLDPKSGIADHWGVSESFFILGTLMLLLCVPLALLTCRAARMASRSKAEPTLAD